VVSPSTAEGAQHARRVFGRLAATLKQVAAKPNPEAVHHLRTTIRRIETMVRAHAVEERRGARKLLKQLGRLRRRAGRVRDLDVQLIALRGLSVEVSHRDLAILRQQLEKTHGKRLRRLQAAVEAELSEGLSGRARRVLERLVSDGQATASSRDSTQAALRRFQALAQRYPEFTEANLHEFRIRCKRVRYLAEMGGESPESQPVIAELMRIQDSVGEWHDWVALAETAEQVLPHPNSSLLSLLRAQRRLRFLGALRTTVEARRKLFALAAAAAGRKKPATGNPGEPAPRRSAAVA
jgi:CHAD domain-containing protein